MKVHRRQSLVDRARRGTRNIGVSDKRRRQARDQTLFGAFIETRAISPAEIAAHYQLSVPLLYRYMRGIWHKPQRSTIDRFCHWFFKQTRRTLSVEMMEVFVSRFAPQSNRTAYVEAWIERNCPIAVQDSSNVGEIVLK